MMPKFLFTLILSCGASFHLYAQINNNLNDIDESKRKIAPLDSGKFEIREFTYNNDLVYVGCLSSTDPIIRDGEFTFYDIEGNRIASGSYSDDVPIGEWIYFDTDKSSLANLNYNSVWNFFEKQDEIVPYDTIAMENLSKKWRKLMKDDGTFDEVDEVPLYNGSEFYESFKQHVRENMILPAFEQRNNQKYAVIAQFTLDYVGNIRNIQILQSNSTDLAIEALRVILASKMNWKSAKVEGVPVNVKVAWEFDFRDAIEFNQVWYEPPPFYEDSSYVQEFTYDTLTFYVVEDMPAFNNGDPALEFRKFIASELRYPEEAAKEGQEGRVIIQFRVDPRGVVCDPFIVRSVYPLLDEEAIRVVMASPRWTPGFQRGKPVSVLFTFPISFKLSL